MKSYKFAFLALVILSFACTKVTPTPIPTGEVNRALGWKNGFPTPNAEAEIQTPTPSALGIVGNVYIRNSPNAGALIVGSLGVGDSPAGQCSGDWCSVGNGYVWRGCTSDNPNGLGCSEAE